MKLMKYLLLLFFINPAQAYMSYEYFHLGWIPLEKEWSFTIGLNHQENEERDTFDNITTENENVLAVHALYGISNKFSIGIYGSYLLNERIQESTPNLPVTSKGVSDPSFVFNYRLASQYPRYFSLDLFFFYFLSTSDMERGFSSALDSTQGNAKGGGDVYRLGAALNHQEDKWEFNIQLVATHAEEKTGKLLAVPPPDIYFYIRSSNSYTLALNYQRHLHRMWSLLLGYRITWNDEQNFSLPGNENKDDDYRLLTHTVALRYHSKKNSFYELRIVFDKKTDYSLYTNGAFTNRIVDFENRSFQLSYSYLY